MAQLIKSAKSTVILLILLVSLLAASVPVNAAIPLNSNIDVVWGEKDTVKPVVPRDEIRKLNFTHRGVQLILNQNLLLRPLQPD